MPRSEGKVYRHKITLDADELRRTWADLARLHHGTATGIRFSALLDSIVDWDGTLLPPVTIDLSPKPSRRRGK